jgi:hypothetical protein
VDLGVRQGLRWLNRRQSLVAFVLRALGGRSGDGARAGRPAARRPHEVEIYEAR